MNLPLEVLGCIFQNLNEFEVKKCKRVSKGWLEGSNSATYYSSIAMRDGIVGKGEGVSAKDHYNQFERQIEIKAEERWIIRYDPIIKNWEIDEELLKQIKSINNVAVISACCSSNSIEGLQNTTNLLSSLMRCKPSSTFTTPSADDLQIGIKCWSLPLTMRTGVSALFLMGVTNVPQNMCQQLTAVRDISSNPDGSDSEEEQRTFSEYSECVKVMQLLQSISSHLFVVDDACSTQPWWTIFPSGYTPPCLGGTTSIPIPVDASKLTVISESDLCIPTTFNDQIDKQRVANSFYHFEEVCFLKVGSYVLFLF